MSLDVSWKRFKQLNFSDELMEEMDDVEKLEEEKPIITFFRGSGEKSPFIGWNDGEHPQLVRLEDADVDLNWNEIEDLIG